MGGFSFPKSDLQSAETLLAQGKVGSILFSEGTYQVEVKDKKKSLWPFLQLDDEGGVLDHFCTCAVAEEKLSCPHQAAAWLKILSGKLQPLHVRFRVSLWNELCQIASRRHGYDPDVLQGNLKTGFKAFSSTGKELFSCKPLTEKGRKKLKEILKSRPQETEETSLKFSNLSPDELALWKEGRPSDHLQYELSFWSDLAKWWMALQEEGEDYHIHFEPKNELPKEIHVAFHDVSFTFYVAQANWNSIVPALATVESPLKIFELTHHQIKRIVYDPLKKAFELDLGKTEQEKHRDFERTFPVGEWIFAPDHGFYPSRMDAFLQEREISSSQLGSFLQKHPRLVEKYLVGTQVHADPLTPKYHIHFDAEWNFHLSAYLFEEGDLQQVQAAYFPPWVYLPSKGFYLLEELLFEELHKSIPRKEVGDFVSRHRHFLSAYEGFQTHVGGVETQLTYRLTKEGLKFEGKLEIAEEREEIIDFGDWIYLPSRGFYAKIARRSGQLIRPGQVVPKAEIPAFIRTHRDELETIPDFFASTSPVTKSGLAVSLTPENKITVSPKYEFLPSYAQRGIHIFDTFTYVEEEGFCEIPALLRLPDPFGKEVIIDDHHEPYFVAFEVDALMPFITSIDPRLKKPHQLALHIRELSEDAAGWRLSLSYVSDVGSIGAREVWQGVSNNQRYLFSKAGLLLLKTPRFNWLKNLPKKRWEGESDTVILTPLEWMRLFALEEVVPPSNPEGQKLFIEFSQLRTTKPFDLTGLRSQLRNYQETGLQWLWFLFVHGLSGLLCDEMGLGKTHQAMALLAAVHNAQPAAKFLVVCPTSVIYHWQELLRRFFPQLRVLVFYGIHRALTDCDLILTSYGTLRSERGSKNPFSDLSFDVAIFDEIQIAKNIHSQTHKALKAVLAKTRIGLTGTPIENRLLELKALFDVILPTYMPTDTVFKELFVHPIEKQNDHEKKNLLQKFIHPFILRRKKSEVLLELPEKIEEISYADLSEEQKKLYQETYKAHREGLLRQLKNPSEPVPYLHIFSLLTKLKQICDHPSLIFGDSYKQHTSGKWDLFLQLLEETRASGQKLVVFSQYLGMLDIIESHLAEAGIGFAAIRGSTRDRKAQIDKFQTDPTCEVFVGSLQAAGVGIDLIAASVVIHYDRWWNPAKENQATDRVHRMGQSRGVQVFKMVTKGTIEEHIHRLIEKKVGLLEEVIGYDDQDQIKLLNREELLRLLTLMEDEFEGG